MNMDPDSWPALVAAAIRAEMVSRHHGTEALAELLGVERTAVAQRLLDGDTPFDLVEVERVAAWFGIAPSELLARAPRASRLTHSSITSEREESCQLCTAHHNGSGSAP